MKNNPVLFIGVFGSLALSWVAVVWGSHVQTDKLGLQYDPLENVANPAPLPGVAARGQLVYQDLGCGACHTQQIRRQTYAYDIARGWGERQSVARDYMLQSRPQFGLTRQGPDLTNYQIRASKDGITAAKLHEKLYTGSKVMPSFAFLYTEEPVSGEKSNRALSLATPRGSQLVASERAESLVAYLLSLKQDYALPEAPAAELAAENK
jgi:cytochrome c oxidase cbb3-type subunit 2